jgi:DNA-binding MarR family transcriptional regulator
MSIPQGVRGTVTMIAPDVERAAGELRACLGPLVRRLRQVQVDGELTLSQVSVLVRLEREGPSTPGALAAVEEITPQSMGSILAALAQGGLVSRADDPSDGRRVLISITSAGQESLQGVRHQRARRLARAITETLTPAEQRQLIEVIPLLERVVQRV